LFQKAEKIATELLDIDNTHIEICYQCANLFVKQEKLDEAIEVLDAVFGKTLLFQHPPLTAMHRINQYHLLLYTIHKTKILRINLLIAKLSKILLRLTLSSTLNNKSNSSL
jgi:hypothetical protein